MTSEEKLSLLDLDIKKIQLDLAKADACLAKMMDLRQEEAIKIAVLDANRDFLRDCPTIVSLIEYSNISKNRNKLLTDLQFMDSEISKLNTGYLLYRKKYEKMIEERGALLSLNKKGVILEFKRK